MGKRNSQLTQALVREALEYDPLTGLFRHRVLGQHHFASYRSMCSWNARWAGKPALSTQFYDVDGQPTYLGGSVLGEKQHMAHCIAWLYVHGSWPEPECDHRDRNKTNNRLVNLQEVSRGENMRNKGKTKNNTSGRTGVRLRPNGKYEARIAFEGKMVALGYFQEFDDAVAARVIAEKRFGYSADARR
jgi:hypothetical protein